MNADNYFGNTTVPTEQTAQGPAPGHCPGNPDDHKHHMVNHHAAHSPIFIDRCSSCGWIDGQEIARQIAELTTAEINKARGPLLGLATTRQCLDELRSRGDTGRYFDDRGDSLTGDPSLYAPHQVLAWSAKHLLASLPSKILDYRTVGND